LNFPNTTPFTSNITISLVWVMSKINKWNKPPSTPKNFELIEFLLPRMLQFQDFSPLNFNWVNSISYILHISNFSPKDSMYQFGPNVWHTCAILIFQTSHQSISHQQIPNNKRNKITIVIVKELNWNLRDKITHLQYIKIPTNITETKRTKFAQLQ